MANTVSIISYGNTFGELVTTQNALTRENNNLAANNYIKDTGTLFLNEPDLGLQVANNAVVQGGLKVQGIGSYATIDNNLRVDGQIYFTNNVIGMTNYGQANVYGLLYANASGNSIISTNNITVGGNTFITGNVYSANNLVIAKNALINGEILIHGTSNVANNLLVSQNVYVRNTVTAERIVANTSVNAPTVTVTGLLDASLATSTLHVVTANNFTATRGYISTLQSNTLINAASTNTTTLYAQTLTTPVANVGVLLDANAASGFINNLNVNGEFSVGGNFTVLGTQVYTSNTFTLNSGVSSGYNGFYTVERGPTANSARLRWNEALSYWDVNDVSTNQYYKILTSQVINDTLTSTSNIQVASANTSNTLYTLLTNANNYLQSAVAASIVVGNNAFSRANSAFNAANNVAPQIAPTYERANASYERANTSANIFFGTTGSATPSSGSVRFSSNNGIVIAGASSNNIYINTPQDLRSTGTPTFDALTLTNALPITQGGTGAQSSSVALQNLLPSTVGVPSGYVLGTTGGLGASYNWVAGGTGGGGSTITPGTRITTNRLAYTAATNQTEFVTPSYVTGSGQLRVYVNGVRQYTSDYAESSTTSVTMNNALTSGDTVLVEVDGYYSWNNWANTTSFTAPFGGIVSSANTVQSAIQDVETRKATLASPSFTGLPTAPTAPVTTANTVMATTGFVANLLNASGSFAHNITGSSRSVASVGVVSPEDNSTREPTGLSFREAYNNSYPTTYGNVLVLGGGGGTELLMGWSGSTGAHADNYIRSRRESGTTWSGWAKLITDQNIGSQSVTSATSSTSATYAGYLNNAYAYTNGTDGWFRSVGATGWQSVTHGGGIYMEDTSWVRVYNSKGFYVSNAIAATGDIIAYYSDERLKENKGNITGALDAVSKLNGFRYTNNALAKEKGYTSDEVQIGLSAQEVESVFPEVVTLAPFDMKTLEDGTIVSESGENYKTLNYAKLVPVLVEAIKELKAEIEELKGKIK